MATDEQFRRNWKRRETNQRQSDFLYGSIESLGERDIKESLKTGTKQKQKQKQDN